MCSWFDLRHQVHYYHATPKDRVWLPANTRYWKLTTEKQLKNVDTRSILRKKLHPLQPDGIIIECLIR
jgi:hypothetical protein